MRELINNWNSDYGTSGFVRDRYEAEMARAENTKNYNILNDEKIKLEGEQKRGENALMTTRTHIKKVTENLTPAPKREARESFNSVCELLPETPPSSEPLGDESRQDNPRSAPTIPREECSFHTRISQQVVHSSFHTWQGDQ